MFGNKIILSAINISLYNAKFYNTKIARGKRNSDISLQTILCYGHPHSNKLRRIL